MSVRTPTGGEEHGIAEDSAHAHTVVAAEGVLSRRFGAPVALADPQDLGGGARSSVLRVRVAHSPFSLPSTMVVKRHTGGGDPVADEMFCREAVSYQLFTAFADDNRICPELFAHDGEAKVLVLEDLGSQPTLADTLLGDDPRAAEQALVSFAHSLGRLHASTATREQDFDALMRRFSGGDEPMDQTAQRCAHAVRELPELLCTALDVSTPPAVSAMVAEAVELFASGRYRAFSPSALSPENNLVTGKGVRFVDFKGGCVRDALLDAAYLRVPFPSWRRCFGLPPGMSEAMLAAWRAEVGGIWPELEDDDVLAPRLLRTQLMWVWVSTWTMLPGPGEPDSPMTGTAPAPGRAAACLGRWQRLAREAEALPSAEPVAEHAHAVVDALHRRFGPELELPRYPVFAES